MPCVPPESQVFVSKRLAQTEKNFPQSGFRIRYIAQSKGFTPTAVGNKIAS
jgi:hypothetical protein